MIVKILGSASSNFHGVQYNDKKVEKGTGELMLMKNFPSFIDENSSQEEVRNYLKSISKNEKVKKHQFHAVISTKFQQHSKEELTKVAEDFMQEMGYGNQPFIVVFHNDTENNHVHIVSTRVEKSTGKKINDSYEKLKAQKAMMNVKEWMYGKNNEEIINSLLNYKMSSLKQLELLMEKKGFKLVKNKNNENALDILKNGVREKTINGNQLIFSNPKNDNRAKQIKAILNKYKELYSNKVFKVEDRRHLEKMLPEEKQKENWKPRIEFESELQKKLREVFGIDVVFHQVDEKSQSKEKSKGGLRPFGYTLIDHKTETIYKGSDILKMNNLFEFTSEVMDKKLFESLKDYNLSDEISKQVLIEYLKHQNPENVPKDFMLFENKKRKNKEVFNSVKNDVRNYLKTQNNNNVKIIKSEEGIYNAVHAKLHYVGELQSLIGEKEYQSFLNPNQANEVRTVNQTVSNEAKELSKAVNEMLFEWTKHSGTSKDPAEEELKKEKKKEIMIITFATQKGGTGKTTLAIAFANYISALSERKIKVYDFDFQKSFYYKWKEDEQSDLPKLYEVETIGEDKEQPFSDFETLINMKESDEINLFDLAGTLDQKYSDLLIYSDFIIIPFEYSDVSVKSTLVFKNLLGLLESEAERIFIRSKYDKGYKYPNQKEMDEEISKYGTLIENPVYKRNSLQIIDTRKLTYEQKYAVKKPFNEIIDQINSILKITL